MKAIQERQLKAMAKTINGLMNKLERMDCGYDFEERLNEAYEHLNDAQAILLGTTNEVDDQ